MTLQVTVTMVSTLVLEEELHLTLLGGTGSKDLSAQPDTISRVIPCGGIHLFTKDGKLPT
jgi:hypothetical protein